MRVSGYINNSLINGKGMRFVIFTQGCHHRCPGCHNEHTWQKDGGYEISIDELVEMIEAETPIITGVTISGGEPFNQSHDVIKLIIKLKTKLPSLDIAIYTGYKIEEIEALGLIERELMYLADVIIDGKFDKNKTDGALKYTGSSNQKIHYKKGFSW